VPVERVIAVSEAAGKAIMEVYNGEVMNTKLLLDQYETQIRIHPPSCTYSRVNGKWKSRATTHLSLWQTALRTR